MVSLVWVPIVVIGVLHYSTGAQHHWVHDVLRRMYYLPIVIGALFLGLRGGISAAFVVSITYLPHAFLHPEMFDPGRGVEKALEIVLYFVVGSVAGSLAGSERKHRAELQEALIELQHSLDEQKRLTGQLVRAGRLSALGEVVAGIAHEIKNPLHSLAGTAEVIDPLIPENVEERRLWEIHVSELERLKGVAERFLSFARPQSFEPLPVDLREVIRRLEDLVGAQARQQNVEIRTELPDRAVMIEGDRDQLAQLAINIVLNALSTLRDSGGKIHITMIEAQTETNGLHQIRIENNGPEIPKDMLEHIFDPFVSGDDQGTGLGLSISARIAEQHQGYIEAANDGLGVSFSIFLPPQQR